MQKLQGKDHTIETISQRKINFTQTMDKNITIDNKFLEDKMRFDEKYVVEESNSDLEYLEESSDDIT